MPSSSMSGFRGFLLVWFGQLISLTGSAMTRFAFTIWIFAETESATALAMMGFFAFAPLIVLSPVAGALVDRWPRKMVLMLTDGAAGFSTIILLILFSQGNLELWHIYAASAFASAFEAFQFPAFSASITLMVEKKDFARASAMLGLAQSVSAIGAPVLAGAIIALGDITTVMMIDIVTFVFALTTIAIVFIPQPKQSLEGVAAKGNLWQESMFGFKYIWKRPSLFGMQMIFFFANLFGMMAIVLTPVLVLSQTDNDEALLGIVQSAAGVGGLVGGLIMAAWGGPKRRAYGVFLGIIGMGLFGQVLIGIGGSAAFWIAGSFLMFFFIPMMNASNQAIWQAKIPPDLQGRVFSVRRLIAQISAPLAMLSAGPLADHVFGPAMEEGGWLAPVFGGLLGTGTGAGLSLIFIIFGVLAALDGFAGFVIPVVRNIEEILPDHVPDTPDDLIAEPGATAFDLLQGDGSEIPAPATAP